MYLPTYLLTHACRWERVKRGYRNRGHPTPLLVFFSGPPRPHPQFPNKFFIMRRNVLAVKSDTLYPALCRVDSLCIMTCALYLPANSTAELAMESFTPITFSGEIEKMGGWEAGEERGPAVLLITSNSRHSPGRWGKISH
jgi:hypothetical protein